MEINVTGIGGFIVLVLDLWAIISVIGSGAGTGTKVIWVLVILFLPILGFWMIPLGLIVLSHDLPAVRRRRRRMTVWWSRRQAAKRNERQD